MVDPTATWPLWESGLSSVRRRSSCTRWRIAPSTCLRSPGLPRQDRDPGRRESLGPGGPRHSTPDVLSSHSVPLLPWGRAKGERFVDLPYLGANLDGRPDRSEGAIWAACWSKQAPQHRARYRSPSRC
jgi:hypothetical protein